MAIFETVLKSDLKKPVQVKQLSGNLFSGDNQGNKITVEVMDNGSAATLSGGVTGYVIREDNATVTISSGTLSGNKASIILPEEAYNVVGRVSIVIKVGTTTVGACTAYVYRTSTDVLVDPTGTIPSLQELLSKISACETATANANKVANMTVSAEEATGDTPDVVMSEIGSGSGAHKHLTFKLVKGDHGVNSYVHIRWADSQPSADNQMKTTPSAWIGIYTGTSSTAPTSYSEYTWYKYKGETGATGATGATPNISIGTVTTGEPGTNASASIGGTVENPVLNLSIPRGMPGDNSNVLLFDENGYLYINVNEE